MSEIVCSDNPTLSVELEELKKMIATCNDEVAMLDSNEENFIDQMERRVSRYEDGTFISEKQLNWLKKIYEKVGG